MLVLDRLVARGGMALAALGLAALGTLTAGALVALYVTGLVLLDELPTGTRITTQGGDASLGAAKAITLDGTLLSSRRTVVATSHHSVTLTISAPQPLSRPNCNRMSASGGTAAGRVWCSTKRHRRASPLDLV